MSENQIVKIKLDDIYANYDFNCRFKITSESILDLKIDIANKGLLQPLIVTNNNFSSSDKPYTLIAGFRRFTALKEIQKDRPSLNEVDCTLVEIGSEADARVINLTENFQREDLSIIEEAFSLKYLKDAGLGRHKICSLLGKSDGWVQNRLIILNFPADLYEDIIRYKFTIEDIKDLNTVLSSGSVAMFREAFYKLRDAKIRGYSHRVRTKSKPSVTRARRKQEIQMLINHILINLGEGLATYVLAWAAGNISDLALDEHLKNESEIVGCDFVSFLGVNYEVKLNDK